MSDGPMKRARLIVEKHIRMYGHVPAAHRLIEAIAADLSFIELAATPHRDGKEPLSAGGKS